jgi:hypothetical protein
VFLAIFAQPGEDMLLQGVPLSDQIAERRTDENAKGELTPTHWTPSAGWSSETLYLGAVRMGLA